MRQLYGVFILMFWFKIVFAQNFVGWEDHLPYNKAVKVLAANEMIYCLTESGLFSYSLIDNEILAYNIIKGLSDSEVSSIGWEENKSLVVIGYSNGNVDLKTDDGIVNIPDIKRFSLFASKKINNIFVSDNLAYLSTDFGIVVINLDKSEIADTYLIGDNGSELEINDIFIFGNQIYAASVNGLYQAELGENNLADFNNWNKASSLPNNNMECVDLEMVNGQIHVQRNISADLSELYKLENNEWSLFLSFNQTIHSIRSVNERLNVVTDFTIQEFNSGGQEINRIVNTENSRFRDIAALDNRIFIADFEKSLLEFRNGQFTAIKPDGPLRSDITSIHSVGKNTWACAGNYDATFENQNIEAELYLNKNREWINYSKSNTQELDGLFDIVNIASNKRNSDVIYAGTWGNGLIELEDERISTVYHSGNSPLDSKGIIAMSSDLDGNLWILDALSAAPVKVLTNQKEWISLSFAEITNQLNNGKIVSLSNGDKWVLRGEGESLFAFNENGTVANTDDDVSRTFFVRDENNSTLSSNIYDIEEDVDGSVWMGTSNGVAVYGEPGNIFRDGDFYAYRPIITIDGSTQFLLASELVQCVEVNGANQKWFGTGNSGAFLVSESGDEQLNHFTTENSPLPSNNINDISVNPATGEVFFVTDKGMVSYRGKVTVGAENFNDLYVYPNPVRETYRGDVTVTGLMSNSTVKITDVSGNLVWEGESEGGQFVWNGSNFNGSRVHTGVYLIFCSNEDGSESKVIKLLFIH